MHSSPAETRWQLIGRAARGDAEARSTFGRTYLPLVRSFLVARWRRSPLQAEIDDAVQEVFVECLRPDGPLVRADPEQGDFRGYLFGIVRNVAMRIERDTRRRQQHDQRDQEHLLEVASDDEHLSKVFDREWARSLMQQAGELLRARAATGGAAAALWIELLRLRFGANLPIRDIAAQWEMDVDAVHRCFARAREAFRSCLRQVIALHAVRTEAELDDECRRLLALLE